MDFKDWDIDTLDKHVLNLIHNEPESSTKLRGIEQTQVHKNSKLVGSQRILNFVSGSGFDAVNRPEKESIDISLPVSSGIQFDTYPQDGDWLHINTTGNREGVSNGTGILLAAAYNIDINTGLAISLLDTGGGGIYLTSRIGPKGGSFIGIQADGETFIQGDVIVFRSSGHNIEFQSGGFPWVILNAAQAASFKLGSGQSFDILSSLSSSIFGASSSQITATASNVTATSSAIMHLQSTGVGTSPEAMFIETNGAMLIRAYKRLHIESLADQVFSPGMGLELAAGNFMNMNIFTSGGPVQSFSFSFNGSNTVLRIDSNGTYHIKTGATWVADL